MFDSPEIEQYYRVKTVAARLGLSRQTVERRFADIDGGKRDGTSRSTRSKRKYAIMLIPESAIRAYLDSLRE